MQRTKIVTGVVVFSCLVACGKTPKYTPPPPATPSPKPSDCLTKNDVSLDPNRPVQRKTIELKRQRQRTIHRDCNKNPTAERMEQIVSPYQSLVITPTTTKESDLTGSAYNRTTCSGQKGGLTQLFTALFLPWTLLGEVGKSQIKITVDSSPTADNMRVNREKDNYIDYEFTRCVDKKSQNATCSKTETVERGTLVLTIKYSEPPDIETPREVDDCDKNRQNKP